MPENRISSGIVCVSVFRPRPFKKSSYPIHYGLAVHRADRIVLAVTFVNLELA